MDNISNSINDKKRSVIFYELNEMPLKILNFYIEKNPNSNFSKILKKAAFFETIVNEDRHLHPWSVWPSVHRGVSSKKHKINFINQDLSESVIYPPLWEIISQSNKNVGVHGSLQSYPPKKNKNIKFYLPDTFAPDAKAYPKGLSFLQEFNLYMIKISQGINKLSLAKIIKLVINIIKSKDLRLVTCIKIISHYLKSKLYKKYNKRRSIFQSTITFDSFINQLKKNDVVFCTYFTNHLAGMMHRYWKDFFPKSFNDESYMPSKFNSDSILLAMKESDYHLGELMEFAKKNNSDLLIISGLGQDKRIRGKYLGELQIFDFEKFKKTIFKGNNGLCFIQSAMLPDICISITDKNKIAYVLKKFRSVTDKENNPIFNIPYSPVSNTVNLSQSVTIRLFKDREVLISGKSYKLDDLGIRLIEREQGTAYHIPQGCLIWYSPENDKLRKLASKKYKPDILEIAPSICKLLKIKIPEYMLKESPLINIF